MPLAEIQNVPSTEAEIAAWSFANSANHVDVIRRIYETQNGKQLTSYFIDNFDPKTLGSTGWLYLHAIMHQQMDAALNIQPADLSTLDWQDPDSVANWFNLHTNEHQQASSLLGIG